VSAADRAEDLLRALAPRVLGAVVRGYGNFADAEDAVQEALVAAATSWAADGVPDNPLAWLVRVASRRMADQYRRDDARRRREDLAASWSATPPDPVPGRDDTLIVLFMCCHPALTPAAAIPLTLRAVGGLTTREIATAFLVPEPTMAQRISRAKAALRASETPFALPSPGERAQRLRSVLHVLYLMFNEGYATSGGPDLARTDLSGEAIRLARAVHDALPDDPEVAGLLALMLLTDARRPARTGDDGELVPLAEQDRTRWDRDQIAEGTALVTGAMVRGPVGEYQLQAAIAALHDQARRHDDTDWVQIASLYDILDELTGNPMVTLNRAAATAMARGPAAGLAALDGLEARLGDHHRLRAVRAHLLELAGDAGAAAAEFRAAAARATNLREQQYLTTKAARLTTGGGTTDGGATGDAATADGTTADGTSPAGMARAGTADDGGPAA
jgi:RNA polymerase sigma factor (sigma-70 family)